ncbi:MAG: chitobiase/beta-hexosaminidase C-terminal domain-containing protein [Cytophagales bacterium]|nr:chitobiase/beta-hexosaminidase C-terminal domain-containing protein [Cytophagales bacterium]
MQEPGFYLNIARFHPLIVHMPIGILFFAFALEVVKRLKKRTDMDFSIGIALFLGAASSIAAVATGLMLADEGGYENAALNWHKWMGIVLAVVSVLAFLNHAKQYFQQYQFPVLALVSLLLVFTGHFGGNMTHGEDYLFSKPVDGTIIIPNIDEALVFDQIIKPILDTKCNSCHNPSKAKGELVMTTTAGLLSGGKGGAIFDFEDHLNSSFLKRVDLPMEDDKHMPPKGKSQLTADEIALLQWWISNEACIECRVAEMEEREPLDDILQKFSQPVSKVAYDDVDPLSEKEYQGFWEEGYAVQPVAEENPMVIVNLAFRDDIQEKGLKPIRSIAENVLELNLAGSDFTDDQSSQLSKFTYLKKLQLQNTAISEKTIGALSALQYLESLNLYGTAVTDEVIPMLKEMPGLKNLYVWNANTTRDALEDLKNAKPLLNIHEGAYDDIFDASLMAPPIFSIDKEIFQGTVELEMKTALRGASIYYTLDGSEPDTLSERYDEPIVITKSVFLKAISHKPGWDASDVAEKRLIATELVPVKAVLAKHPSEKYKGMGGLTLIDGLKGTQRFTDGKWIGYEGEDATVTLELANASDLNRVTVSALSAQGSWIFYPTMISISYSKDGKQFEAAGKVDFPLEQPKTLVDEMNYFDVPVNIKDAKFVRVDIRNVQKNPWWHPNPDGKSWIFLDEILLN